MPGTRESITKSRAITASIAAPAAIALALGASPAAVGGGGLCGGATGSGADVIVSEVHGSVAGQSGGGLRYWGELDGVRAYSIGTTACNVGTVPLNWFDFGTPTPTLHPVIAQNLYRLEEGRFEQIGMSWLKHGFCAFQQFFCDTCNPVGGGGCEDQLGVGCSDPYGATTNGAQNSLGPRSEIDPASGTIMVWPFTPAGTASLLQGRVRVRVDDLDPALHPGALYFAEAQYVMQDDAAAGNDDNNASWRQVEVDGFTLPFVGETQPRTPAIQAWQAIDPGVQIECVDVPGDGRLHLACAVTANADGTWHYEYALHNMSSDRAVGGLAVPAAVCVVVQNIAFRDIAHHSGEPYSTADWATSRADGEVSWRTEAHAVDPDANALRWGTLFNYRFDADVPPRAGEITIELFKPGRPGAVVVAAMVPDEGVSQLAADCAGPGDGRVDVVDLLELLSQWGGPGSCDIVPAGGDGGVGVGDLQTLLAAFGATSCR